MLKVLEKILYSSDRGSFEGRLTAVISRVSAMIICGTYAAIALAFSLKYDFTFDPGLINYHLVNFAELFNSLPVIIIFTLISITSMIPGIAALFFGLMEVRTRHGKKTLFWGLFGFFIGTAHFYLMFKFISPA